MWVNECSKVVGKKLSQIFNEKLYVGMAGNHE